MLSEPRERSNWFDWEDEGRETQFTFKESMEDCQEETKVKGSLGKRKNTGKAVKTAKYSGNQEQYELRECRLNHD